MLNNFSNTSIINKYLRMAFQVLYNLTVADLLPYSLTVIFLKPNLLLLLLIEGFFLSAFVFFIFSIYIFFYLFSNSTNPPFPLRLANTRVQKYWLETDFGLNSRPTTNSLYGFERAFNMLSFDFLMSNIQRMTIYILSTYHS